MLKLTDVTWLYQHLPMRFSLSVRPGEMIAVLGPSGAGKSTLLNLIAGFLQPASGSIIIENNDHTYTPPARRPVSMLFQENNLFTHLTVRQNIALGMDPGLKLNDAQRQKLEKIAGQMGITTFIDRLPGELSGGQRQRVALARAIVCEPQLLLLDEPLSALDASLREQMQIELKNLQARLGTTFVMVTHDQTEALSISDRIAVMQGGEIEQIASPAELYDRPATRFVAGFIGTMNLLPGKVAADGRIEIPGSSLPMPEEAHGFSAGSAVVLGLRPEDLEISATAAGVPLRVENVVFHGRSLRVIGHIESGEEMILDVPRAAAADLPAAGAMAALSLRAGAVPVVLPA